MQRIDERRFKTIVEQATRNVLNEQQQLNEMGFVKGLGKIGKGIWNGAKSLLGVGNKAAKLDAATKMAPILQQGGNAAKVGDAFLAMDKAGKMMRNTSRARWALGAGLAGLGVGSMLGGGGQPQTPPPGLMPPMSDPYAGYGGMDPYAAYGGGYSDPYAGYGYGDPYAGYYGY